MLIMEKAERRAMLILLYILCGAGAIFLVIVLFHAISALTHDRRIEYPELTYASPKIAPQLNEYTLAFITDPHHISEKKLRQIAANITKRNVDLLLLGGDFANGPSLDKAMQILGEIVTKDGIYGVDGNHDDYVKLFDAMEKYGIQPLDNAGVRLRPDLYLAGVQDLWKRLPDIKKAVRNAEEDDFVLLLAHNPYLAMLQNTSRVDLMLCGHTHGGQVTFFGLWTPALTNMKYIMKHGQKFVAGWIKAPYGTDVFISRGTGSVRFTPRVYAPPQVVYLTLQHGDIAGPRA